MLAAVFRRTDEPATNWEAELQYIISAQLQHGHKENDDKDKKRLNEATRDFLEKAPDAPIEIKERMLNHPGILAAYPALTVKVYLKNRHHLANDAGRYLETLGKFCQKGILAEAEHGDLMALINLRTITERSFGDDFQRSTNGYHLSSMANNKPLIKKRPEIAIAILEKFLKGEDSDREPLIQTHFKDALKIMETMPEGALTDSTNRKLLDEVSHQAKEQVDASEDQKLKHRVAVIEGKLYGTQSSNGQDNDGGGAPQPS